ncbi:MAG: 2-dehydropantoate 2-reductase [Methylococcaceae bacterium]|jgi:2-dehydropantoate 2-reductase
MTCKILVVGAGAIGGFYGSLLAKIGLEVSVVGRTDYDTMQQQGIQIESTLGHWTFKPAQILRHAHELEGVADYVLLCTKVIPSVDRVALIQAAISPQTAIVLIQNGIDIEQEIHCAFPNHEIISGLAFICSNRIAPAKILHLAYGRLLLGNWPNSVSAKTEQLSVWFRQAGIECNTSADIVNGRWQKCVWNAPFNPLSVLSGGLPTLAILHSQETFIRQIMQEVCLIAAAVGQPLPEDIIEQNIARTYNMPPYKTSMLLDFENGRAMETEAILGNTLSAAARVGIACPHLESVYALMQLRQLQLNQSP